MGHPNKTYAPTGQGLRIKISLEETSSGKSFDHVEFMSYDKVFEHSSPVDRFGRIMEEANAVVRDVFKNQFLDDIVSVYKKDKKDN